MSAADESGFGSGTGVPTPSVNTPASSACECDGSGRIVDRIPEGDWRPWFTEDVVVRDAGGYSSRVCACRWRLPRREGETTWWTLETVHAEEVELASGPGTVDLEVTTEVPVSEDNYLLVRDAENFYWPTMVSVNGRSLITEDVRLLAAALLRCADKADELDNRALEAGVSLSPEEPVGSVGDPDSAGAAAASAGEGDTEA